MYAPRWVAVLGAAIAALGLALPSPPCSRLYLYLLPFCPGVACVLREKVCKKRIK